MFGGFKLSARLVAMIVGGIFLAAMVLWGPIACQKLRSQGAQSRVNSAQAGAASNSAGDAIATVTRSGEAAAASESLTRSNEGDIKAAQGANESVGAGVNAAGRAALCKRAAYRNDPKCKGAGR